MENRITILKNVKNKISSKSFWMYNQKTDPCNWQWSRGWSKLSASTSGQMENKMWSIHTMEYLFLNWFLLQYRCFQCCVNFCCTAQCLRCMYAPHFSSPFPFRGPQSAEQSPLWCTAGLISYLHYTYRLCTLIPFSQFIPPPPAPAWRPYISSPRLCHYFCVADKIIYIIFLDSTYMH